MIDSMHLKSLVIILVSVSFVGRLFSATSIIPPGLLSNQQVATSSLNNSAVGSSAANITTGLFTIEKTGYYFLANDVVANPIHSNNAIIYIDASNVLLDLGGKTLSLTATSNTKNIVGIKVAPGRTNVTIFNGGVIGYSSLDRGVSAPNSRLTIGIQAENNNNLVLQDLLISSCSEKGIDVSVTEQVWLSNVTTQNIGNVKSVSDLHGAYFYDCQDCYIENSSFDYVVTSTFETDVSSAYGLLLTACSNISISEVSTSNNQVYGTGNVYGLYLNSSRGCRIAKVRAVSNLVKAEHGSGGQIAAGIVLYGATGNTFTDCLANSQTVDGDYILTCSAYGFRITDSSYSNSFLRCFASDNFGGATSVGFFSDSSAYNTYDHCTANGNESRYPGATGIKVYGFELNFGIGNKLVTCEARGNRAYVGDVDPDVLFLDGATAAQVASQEVAGIVMRSEKASSILSSSFSANLGGRLGTVYGIGFYGSCQQCIVSYNEMMTNFGFHQYGFKDFSSDCTTLLRGNIAYGHGKVFDGGEGELTDSGSMNYMLHYAVPPEQKNIQLIIKEGDIANLNAFEAGSTKWFNYSILTGLV